MFKKPLPDFTVQETYPICVDYISDKHLKDYMSKMSYHVFSQSEKYLDLIQKSKLEDLDTPSVFEISKDEDGRKLDSCKNHWFVKLYKYYLSKSDPKYQNANYFYSRIKLDGVNNNYNKRCCYCNNHKIEVVDHFLPESKYIFLAVNPINLVPSCEECNDNKHAYSPSSVEPVLVHPYFDFIDDICWLGVNIVDRIVVTDTYDNVKYDYIFEYFVKDVEDCPIEIKRIKKTFEKLKINNNISFDAQTFFNTELFYDLMDPNELGELNNQDLAEHFLKKAKRLNLQGYGINHWKVALYKMLSEITDFSYLKENPS